MATDPVLVATARHGRACQTGDQVKIADAKQDILEAKLRRAVGEALAAFPPLSSDRKAAVAMMLLGAVK